MNPLWSYALTLMGVTCFWLAGRKVWWTWYVGLATQVVWASYSVTTQQWGFLVGVVLYSWVYANNAKKWTAEHRDKKFEAAVEQTETGTAHVTITADTEKFEDELGKPVTHSVTRGTYRKRAIMVEVRTWDGSYAVAQEIMEWAGHGTMTYQESVVPPQTDDVGPTAAIPACLWINTDGGSILVQPGDSVVKEPFGEVGRQLAHLTPDELVDLYDLIEEG